MVEKRTRKGRINNQVNLSEVGLGKMPPQDVELEEVVIGTLLTDRNVIGEVSINIEAEDFYKESHKIVYTAIIELYRLGDPVDIMTVSNKLKEMKMLDLVGGAYGVTMLTNRAATAHHVIFHCKIIRSKRILRDMSMFSSEINAQSYDESIDPYELIDTADKKLLSIRDRTISSSGIVDSSRATQDLTNMIDTNSKIKGLIGVPTGFSTLDYITGGWTGPNYYIVAARPSMGKTGWLISSLRAMAYTNKRPGLFFSLEMSKEQIMARIISQISGLNLAKIITGKLSEAEMDIYIAAQKHILPNMLFIDDGENSAYDIAAKVKLYKKKYGIEWFAIDYIQLIPGDKSISNRDQQMSNTSNIIKRTCKSEKIPGIALAQLSRDVEKRNNMKNSHKRPILSDLRESGSLEQDGDWIGFLYRAEYYGIEANKDGDSYKGVCELIIRKNRNGPVDTIRLRFHAEQANMEDDLDDEKTKQARRYLGYTGSISSDGDDMPF